MRRPLRQELVLLDLEALLDLGYQWDRQVLADRRHHQRPQDRRVLRPQRVRPDPAHQQDRQVLPHRRVRLDPPHPQDR